MFGARERAGDLRLEIGGAGRALGEDAEIGDAAGERGVDGVPGERSAAGERRLGALDRKVRDRDRAVGTVADARRDARLAAEQPGDDRHAGIEGGALPCDREVEPVRSGEGALGRGGKAAR